MTLRGQRQTGARIEYRLGYPNFRRPDLSLPLILSGPDKNRDQSEE
jgi:hypothetical protein